jgi:hypothetical protein
MAAGVRVSVRAGDAARVAVTGAAGSGAASVVTVTVTVGVGDPVTSAVDVGARGVWSGSGLAQLGVANCENKSPRATSR